jgi:hypothetical protein
LALSDPEERLNAWFITGDEAVGFPSDPFRLAGAEPVGTVPMTEPTEYAYWGAVASAIKAMATKNAKAGGPDINTQISSARFDRFLSRVFSDGGEKSEWLLKGRTSMLATRRVPGFRSTNDVDLASADETTASPDDEQSS